MQSIESWVEAEVPQIVSRELDSLTHRITASTLSHLHTNLLPQLTALIESSSLDESGNSNSTGEGGNSNWNTRF